MPTAKKAAHKIAAHATKEESVPELPSGQPVRYVLPSGIVVLAELLDVGGSNPRIFFRLDGLAVFQSLTQIIGGPTAPYYSADQLPGTWHWPPQGE